LNSPSSSGAKSSLTFLLSVSTLTLAFIASYLCASDPMFRAMMRLSRQADLMSQRYVGELSPERAFADAWRSMQMAIPFRVELVSDTGDVAEEKKLGDWGLLLSTNKGSINVVAVTEGSVFSGALQPGDRVTSVGQDTAGLVTNLRQYLTSRTGDSLFLTIQRGGVAETVKVVVPIPPQHPSLTFSRLDDIVYCGINTINDHLAASLSDSLQSTVDEATKGLILDLRSCRDDSEGDVEKLTRAFLDLYATLPFVLLVDLSTGRQGEMLAAQLLKREHVVATGNVTRPLHAVTEMLPLRSGQRLYVYRDERNVDYFYARDSLINDSLGKSPVGQVTTDRQIIPEIACEPPELSGMTIDLLHRDLLLDFAASSSYKLLPTPEQEAKLFDDFVAFLRQRGYSYDPLGEAFRDLEISARRPDMVTAIEDIRKTLKAQPPTRLDERRGEIIPLLLIYLQEVKIGGEPSLADRIRIDDYCLKAAMAYLKGAHS
jgi:hypothetical protein